MVKTIKIFFIFIFCLFIISITNSPLVSAAPPLETILNFDNGYEIGISPTGFIKQNQDYQLNFFVYNKSNGVHLTNSTISCQFYLANSTGQFLIYQNTTYFIDGHWGINILGANFSYLEVFPFGVKCQDSKFGGATIGYFEVTGTGYELTISRAIIYSVIFLLLIFLFLLMMFVISKLPSGNDSDEDGQIISINNLKYFRGVLLMFEYVIIIGILYLSSNLAFAYLGEQMFAKILFVLFQIFGWMLFPIILIWFIWIFYQIFRDKQLKKMINKGIFPGSKYV